MITQKQIENEIRELEAAPVNLKNCEQLAVLRFLYNVYYAPPESMQGYSRTVESVIPKISDSEFMNAVDGMESQKAWAIMDELMLTLQALYPRMYNAVMRKVREKY